MIKKYIKIIFLNSILLPYVSNGASVKTPIKPALSPVFDEKKYLDRLFAQNGVGTAFIPSTIPGKTSNDTGTPMALQADGCIVVARLSDSKKHFAIARYLPTGEIDRTFGKMGIQSIDCSLTKKESIDTVTALAIQDDGKIIVGGTTATKTTSSTRFAVARFNSNGTLDTTFGTIKTPQAGTQFLTFSIVPVATEDKAMALAIQQDAKIVLGGYSGNPGSLLRFATARFALARFNADGGLDTSFCKIGTLQAGTQYIDFPYQINSFDAAYSIAMQADGKIILGGISCPAYTYIYPSHFALARFNQNGSLDTTFNQTGTHLIGLSITGGKFNPADAIVLQSKGGVYLPTKKVNKQVLFLRNSP